MISRILILFINFYGFAYRNKLISFKKINKMLESFKNLNIQ